MEFEPIKTNKVYEEVINQIREMIYRGELSRGDKLPSERELKKELNVSRASIREAFSALEMIGLIESRPGEGTFIKTDADRNLLEPLSLVLMLENDIAQELLELRKILEVDCVKFASERITEEELEQLAGYLAEMEEMSGFEEESIKLDKNFHHTIAEAGKNNVLYYVMTSIMDAMDFHIKHTRTTLVSRPETMNQFTVQHRKIFEAVKAGDSDSAMKKMEEHLEYVEKLISREIEG
ncbi:FadR/GntR family transcriptional regulator [Halarsenatibacter silvermanii]|uniref:Transcriptional regulator, GntR family n=1 Tax=Halarsenatibacter silvermanii TaxID=321763 RepID=A0A1G9JYH2_9FIRM|nr:FadR/GntR family transcriptional regulator [Halarsenatibacter silvermanii]SDL42276.1 transcriptional regulator, GntR family [Halarsenatibacter silvermanii]